MRQRQQRRLTDRATIERWAEDSEDNGDDDDPFPESSSTSEDGGGWETIAEDVQCAFGKSSEHVRTDSGDIVRDTIEAARFEFELDVEEDDRLTFDRIDGAFEATGIEETVDHRRGVVLRTTVELEDR